VSEFLVEHAQEDQYIVQIFTKIDKLNQKEQSALRREFPNALMVSSAKKRGTHKVIKLLYDILKESQENEAKKEVNADED
jgi:GTP-binding protein